MVTSRAWLRWLLGALGGAAAMIGAGQALALAGGGCAILCRPEVAGIFGAAVGLLVVTPERRD